uniref:Uncharacterized protein n=1 Tax=Ditylenchus dipsaci TaxID=166011 RepID=A0A915ERW5_9BILA
MELYLFRPAEYQQLYNCSLYSIDQVPLKSVTYFLGNNIHFLFRCSTSLYICYWKKIETKLLQILFFLGIIDILCLPVCGLMTGYFIITGAFFAHILLLCFLQVFFV